VLLINTNTVPQVPSNSIGPTHLSFEVLVGPSECLNFYYALPSVVPVLGITGGGLGLACVNSLTMYWDPSLGLCDYPCDNLKL
jgi:hypothetical protein